MKFTHRSTLIALAACLGCLAAGAQNAGLEQQSPASPDEVSPAAELRSRAPMGPGAMPPGWEYASGYEQTLPSDDRWWQGFNDATLDSLVYLAERNNFDLRVAARRIEIAKSALRGARAAWYPQVGVNASWTKAQTSGSATTHHAAPMRESYWDLGLSAQWEIDIFGKVYSNVKSKDELYKATRAEYAGAMVSIAAQVATAYFNMRVAQEQLALAHEQVRAREKLLDMTQARMEAGLGSGLEVAQAKVLLYSTEASVPQLENEVVQYSNAVALLLGLYPEQAAPWLAARADSLPDHPALVATGIPADLLRRRPDVVEAERTMAAYAAQAGVARKDFLPTLSIEGSIGTQAHSAGDLFTHDSFTWSVTPTISWTLFDGFARSAALSEARQTLEMQVDNYNLTLLTAVEEVDNAMSAYSSSQSEIDKLLLTVEQSERALTLSIAQYKDGLCAFSDVVDAQTDVLTYRNSLIAARGASMCALVDLYRSLGGGWQSTY